MPAERAPMRKVREVLRLRHALGVSERQIAVTVGVSRSTVGEYRFDLTFAYLARAAEAESDRLADYDSAALTS